MSIFGHRVRMHLSITYVLHEHNNTECSSLEFNYIKLEKPGV